MANTACDIGSKVCAALSVARRVPSGFALIGLLCLGACEPSSNPKAEFDAGDIRDYLRRGIEAIEGRGDNQSASTQYLKQRFETVLREIQTAQTIDEPIILMAILRPTDLAEDDTTVWLLELGFVESHQIVDRMLWQIGGEEIVVMWDAEGDDRGKGAHIRSRVVFIHEDGRSPRGRYLGTIDDLAPAFANRPSPLIGMPSVPTDAPGTVTLMAEDQMVGEPLEVQAFPDELRTYRKGEAEGP